MYITSCFFLAALNIFLLSLIFAVFTYSVSCCGAVKIDSV